ncbi:hypothetical protein L0Z72_10715 [candidate division KSB1 bacterium]|nr:hypothetical protein [candidate division KSB1 bacterium]
MGITIHYHGHIKDLNLISQLQEEMVDICQTMNWEYQLLNEDLTKPCDAQIQYTPKGANIIGHIPLKGISIQVDQKNENLDILFNPEGKLSGFLQEIMIREGTIAKDPIWNSTKTQFGRVDSHIATVNLLKYVRDKYVPDLIVADEGEYWESADNNILLEKRGFLFNAINKLEKALSTAEIPPDSSQEEIIRKLEEILIKMQQLPNKDDSRKN